jgi:hypothetical protein
VTHLTSSLAECSGASRGWSSPCSRRCASLRVAPVPLRALDPPSAPGSPHHQVGSEEWSFQSHQGMTGDMRRASCLTQPGRS